MRVLVCGSRGWFDEDLMAKVLGDLRLTSADVIVEGCARGADEMSERIGRALHICVEHHPANWANGRSAGIVRNRTMLNSDIDLVLAFWDGESRGTDFTIREAQRRKIPVKVYYQ